MTPDRWQEVKRVLAGALERRPEERSVYLDQTCIEPDLRREVESLIAAHEQGDNSFLERPIVESNEALKRGTKLGPYEILARIGAGGMGDVYRARDARLERDVAIKVLPSGLLTDEGRTETVPQRGSCPSEAQSSQYCRRVRRGGARRHRLFGDGVRCGTVPCRRVEISFAFRKGNRGLGVQIAAALEEAHEHGIVHRDLKPGNIMVTPKRQAKVLDFGLAKLLRPFADSATTETSRTSMAMAGTLPYMAPEQLQGEPVDARTDIHALGACYSRLSLGQPSLPGRTRFPS